MSALLSRVFLGLFYEAVLGTVICFAIDVDINEGRPVFGQHINSKLWNLLESEKEEEYQIISQINN